MAENDEGIVEYRISEWMINPGEISLDSDDRISMRVKRNIYKNLRRSWEDIHVLSAVAEYLSHIRIWEDFLNKMSCGNGGVCDGNDGGVGEEGHKEETYCFVIGPKKAQGQTLEQIQRFEELVRRDFDILLLDCEHIESSGGGVSGVSVKTFRGLNSYIISHSCIKKLMKYIYPVQVKLENFILIYREVFGLKIFANITPGGINLGGLKNDDCPLCDLPNNWNKDNVLIEKWDFYLGRFIQLGVIVAGIYLTAPRLIRIKF
jgi:hypothetical protein